MLILKVFQTILCMTLTLQKKKLFFRQQISITFPCEIAPEIMANGKHKQNGKC